VAHNLGCEASEVFDRVAPVSQTFSKNTPAGSICLFAGERHLPVVDFRGINDSLIPYDGGLRLVTFDAWLSAKASLRRWPVEHRCALVGKQLEARAVNSLQHPRVAAAREGRRRYSWPR
jgi:poly(3-hydroxybutyrate) depolymerase